MFHFTVLRVLDQANDFRIALVSRVAEKLAHRIPAKVELFCKRFVDHRYLRCGGGFGAGEFAAGEEGNPKQPEVVRPHRVVARAAVDVRSLLGPRASTFAEAELRRRGDGRWIEELDPVEASKLAVKFQRVFEAEAQKAREQLAGKTRADEESSDIEEAVLSDVGLVGAIGDGLLSQAAGLAPQ